LKSNKRTLERVARERGYADPDELIQLIPPEQPSRKRK
jgi:hypothetical protein